MKVFFKKLFSLLSSNDKKFLYFMLVFSIFISLLETVGIGAIMPFISVASDFEIIQNNEYYKYIYDVFHFSNEVNFVISFAIVLIMFYIFRSVINLLYFYFLAKFARGRYYIVSYKLLENYIGRDYKSFLKDNSSHLVKTIVTEVEFLVTIISSLLLMISEFFVVLLIYSLMLYVNYKITLLISMLIILNALFLTKTISVKIKNEGSKREKSQKKFYEILNNTFGNFKMLKLKSNDKEVLGNFQNASYSFVKANIMSETLSAFPRLFLEAFGFIIVIAIVAYLVYMYNKDISSTLSLISIFILGLYRLMPSANRILSSYNTIMFKYHALDIVHNDLIYEIEDLGEENISFNEKIKIQNVFFEYEENKHVLEDINLSIKKGTSVAFVGKSGSGKSTLIDILIGLYRPKQGDIFIDEKLLSDENIKSWRSKIGYIPQHIYLFDGSVAQNVAFGEVLDEKKVKEALKKAELLDFLQENHQGVDTLVGENGLKLSGGQKQRVAIARALYANPDILVLDEATSALDEKTESLIMNDIYKNAKDKTLIVIAHRLSTIEKCDIVYELQNGKIINSKS